LEKKAEGALLLSEFLLAALVLGFDAILIVLALFLVVRLLDWSKGMQLPGAHNRIFKIAVVSLVTAIVMLFIVDVEMTVILPAIKSNLLTLIEEIDLIATGVIAILIVFVFITVRRMKRDQKMS
jgi:hypothetical protein